MPGREFAVPRTVDVTQRHRILGRSRADTRQHPRHPSTKKGQLLTCPLFDRVTIMAKKAPLLMPNAAVCVTL